MKTVVASRSGACTACIAARVSRERVEALHSTKSGSAHSASTTRSQSAAAAERPHAVSGRSWSFRLASSVQLSEWRSTIMRRGRRADAEDEGSAPADAFAGLPTRARRVGAAVARGRGGRASRAPRRASARLATANAVIVFSGRGGSDRSTR